MNRIAVNLLENVATCVLVFSICSGVVLAQDTEGYRQFVKRGVTEYSLGNWGEAYAMFEKAHRLHPGPRPLRGMAFALFELKRYVEAKRSIEEALSFEDAENPLSDKLRSELQDLLQQTLAYIVTVSVLVEPDSAEIRLNRQIAQGPQMLVDPGYHTLVISAEGYQSEVVDFEAKIGRNTTFEFKLMPSNGAFPGSDTVSDNSDFRLSELRWLYWTVTGLGAASLVGSIVTGVLTDEVYSDIEKQCPGESCRPALDADLDKGKTLQTVTNVLLISGALLTVTGATLLLLDYGNLLEDRESNGTIAGINRITVSPSCDLEGCSLTAIGKF